ncbi:MAG: M20/M25/M40 family metallo-hydrolase [Acidobacteriota bacterium]
MNRIVSFTACILALLLTLQPILANNNPSSGYPPDEGYEAIELKSLQAHLTFLASNLLEGREASTRGYDIAASYTASLFQQLGLKPIAETANERSFLQVFPIVELVNKGPETLQVITARGDSQITESFSNRTHFLIGNARRTTLVTAPVVFAGYGLVEKDANYDDFANIDVKNKIVVVMTHAPGEGDEKSYFYRKENRNRFFNGMEVLEKRRNAQQRGALALLLINDPLGKHPNIFNNLANNENKKPYNNLKVTTPRRRMVLSEELNENSPIPLITISEALAQTLFDQSGRSLEALQRQINARHQPASFDLPDKRIKLNTEVETRLLNTSNVIGLLEGSDPVLKNEYIIIGAHLDHDGSRDGYIWNGADDDASGSAAVIELAAAFTRAKVKPRRSLLFCLWGAEEKGLLGSRFFTLQPLIPLDKISAVIQLDMIGRDVEPRPHQLKGKPKPTDLKRYIFAETSAQSPEAGEILLRANETAGLEINFESNTEVDGGSDHYSFWLKKIPIISIDDGVYHEDYHQPSDTIEKINFNKVLLVSRLIYLTAREIANYQSKLKWQETKTDTNLAESEKPMR